MPSISKLLVTPATTMLPYSSKRTTAGLCLISKVSVNWIWAKTTSPNLSIFPCLVFLIIPELFHFMLLYFVQELVILVAFFGFNENFAHFLQKLVIGLPWILFGFF